MVLTQGFVESSLGVAPEARKRVAGGKREARSRRSRVVASPPRQGRQRAMKNLPPLPGRVSLLTHPVAALVPRWPPATFLLPLRGKNTLSVEPLALRAG